MTGSLLPEKKIKGTTIKRETYRGKYYVTLREKGKVIERVRWGENGINTREAKGNYKQKNSIFENRSRKTEDTWKTTFESRFVTVQNNKKSEKVPKIDKIRKLKYRYYIKGYVYRENGAVASEIVASSQNHNSDYPVSDAREEAWNSFYERVDFVAHGSQKGHYDANEGMKIVEKGRVKITDEGIIQYRNK